MKLRWTLLASAAALAAVFSLTGCDGDDGRDGLPGGAGDPGLACWDLNENGVKDFPDEDTNGDGVIDVLDCRGSGAGDVESAIGLAKAESCSTCHGDAGTAHQSTYDQYTDEPNLGLEITGLTSVPAGEGFDVTLTYTISGYEGPVESTSFYVVQYDSATGEFLTAPGGFFPTLGAGTCDGDGNCTSTQNVPYDPLAFTGGAVVGSIKNGRLDIEDAQYNPDAGKRVQMYAETASASFPIGDIGDFESAANVEGCVACHGAPYRKHGNIEAVVDGVPDFVHCKGCHANDRDGDHPEWQFMVDDPLAWATGEDPTRDYSYQAVLLNDVHMSHAMELPYPMSMANCATCHAGKLDRVLANENFTAETCRSCHVVEGTNAKPGEAYYQPHRPPPLSAAWPEGHNIGLPCQSCHDGSLGPGVATLSDIHPGYDPRIYTADGERHADLNTLSIDSVEVDGNLITVAFSANNTEIIPEVGVSFYGWNSKDFLVAQHTRGADRVRMEYVPESACPADDDCSNPLFTEEEGSALGAWIVTLDISAYQAELTDPIPDLIADGKVKFGEIYVAGELEVDGVEVGLNAVTQTFDVSDGTFVDNYFQGEGAIADVAKCNNCHDQLAVTFHSGSGRGGSITACRVCHVTTSGGSHLEMQSRSITSYVHAIHSFQDFDSDEIDFTDPVEKARYEMHVDHHFPLFTAQACEGCHMEDAGLYDVPDQSKSMPALLSGSYEWNVDRAIGSVPEYVTGPGYMACGGCHRAALINEDNAGGLAALNGHSQAFGTLVENDEDDLVIYGVINKIMGLFE
ncbi:MAG: hypothetical protein P8080_13205 [Gammaproteobacteria bacterium]